MALALALAITAAAAADTRGLFDPATGYRIAQYRSVVGAPPPGVTRIDDAQARSVADAGGTLMIDVTPAEGAVRDGVTGAWHLSEQHESIPGAHWFPEAGRGTPQPGIEAWFARGVDRLAHGDRQAPIVLFCRSDCWMSWNASWKVARAGYRNVRWYANGIDGWIDGGRPTRAVQPEP